MNAIAATDLDFVWLLADVSVALLVLAIVGQALERIEDRRVRRLTERMERDRDDAYYQKCLETASQVGSPWPPERV